MYVFFFQIPSTSNKTIKSIRKRIDIDGLTKIPDQITSRMFEKERSHLQQIESLHEQMRCMRKFIDIFIKLNNNNNIHVVIVDAFALT